MLFCHNMEARACWSGAQDSSQQLNTTAWGGVFTCGMPVFSLSLTFSNESQSSFTNDKVLSFCFLLSIHVSIYDLRSVYLRQTLGSGWPKASAPPQWVSLFSVCIHYPKVQPGVRWRGGDGYHTHCKQTMKRCRGTLTG